MTVTLALPLFGTYRNGPCCAWASSVANAASAPSQTPPSSAARVIAGRTAAVASRIAPPVETGGADRSRAATRACRDRHRCEAMPRSPRARPPGSPTPRDPLCRHADGRPHPNVREESGPINSGLWVAMAIIGTCGFHARREHGSPRISRCSATLAPRSGERVARAQRAPGEGLRSRAANLVLMPALAPHPARAFGARHPLPAPRGDGEAPLHFALRPGHAIGRFFNVWPFAYETNFYLTTIRSDARTIPSLAH